MKKILSIGTVLISTAALAQNKPYNEKLMTDQKGFFTCSGGGNSAPLFNRDCVKLTLSRVSGGSTKYEGTCLDSNATTFYVACDSFTFEYSSMSINKPKDPTLGE